MRNVLLVDDERMIRGMIETVLQTNFPDQFKFFPAQDAGEAIELLEAHRGKIDLAIIGNKMSGTMSGIEVTEWIKTEYASISVILMSGSYVTDHRADRFLLKSDKILKDLVRFVSELLNIAPTPP